jgi:hypothetical protein
LETESLQRFRYDRNKLLFSQCKHFFSPETLQQDFAIRINQDAEVEKAYKIYSTLRQQRNLLQFGGQAADRGKKLEEIEAKINTAELRVEMAKKTRSEVVYLLIFKDRLGVLEVLLRILPESDWVNRLIVDIRRFLAEAKIMLDVQGSPPQIIPLEEILLQREVIDNLLPRLKDKFPKRADELVQCYHNILIGKDLDSIFSEAFKTLEQIAREITNDKNFEFDKANMNKYFSLIHPTIHNTIFKLAAHRGDKGGHGKVSPSPHEIRYLLFTICNIALLLLEYPSGNKNILNRS